MKAQIIVDLQKDTTFQMRINSEVKSRLEELHGKCGMTMTDAVNCFFQQSLNQGGMPIMLQENNEFLNRILTYMEKLEELESLISTEIDANYPRRCPCCKEGVITETHDVCMICGWEDDEVQNSNPSYVGGANKESLEQHRKNFLEMRRRDKNYRWCDTWN